jgi:hypothetical protein
MSLRKFVGYIKYITEASSLLYNLHWDDREETLNVVIGRTQYIYKKKDEETDGNKFSIELGDSLKNGMNVNAAIQRILKYFYQIYPVPKEKKQ